MYRLPKRRRRQGSLQEATTSDDAPIEKHQTHPKKKSLKKLKLKKKKKTNQKKDQYRGGTGTPSLGTGRIWRGKDVAHSLIIKRICVFLCDFLADRSDLFIYQTIYSTVRSYYP